MHDSSSQEIRSTCLLLEILALIYISCLPSEPRLENGNVSSQGQAQKDNSKYVQMIISLIGDYDNLVNLY